MNTAHYSLGIDLGSISLKLVLLDEAAEPVFARWMRVAGQPLPALSRALRQCLEENPSASIGCIGVTGSGRALIKGIFPAKEINEISAHAAASAAINPDVRTIIEIGGQDSKLIVLSGSKRTGNQHVSHFSMNELCAAGTGAFLDQQAARLGISIDEFAALGSSSSNPAQIAGRCAVFAKTDMTHHQQEGRPLADIAAGLNLALVRSYMSNLVRGRKLPAPIAFQGGVAANKGLADAFRSVLGISENEFIIPAHHKVMGAIGAALLASSSKQGAAIPLASLAEKAGHISVDTKVDSAKASTDKLVKPSLEPKSPDWGSKNISGRWLGIDVGSVSVKLAVLGDGGICFSSYRFSDGKPIDALRELLSDLGRNVDLATISGVGVTGSGRQFIGGLISADVIQNEITAQATAAAFLHPGVDTVIEIGGQDAKFMRLDGARATHFAMNRVCAAGTGAFLQEQAERLQIDLEKDFAKEAFESRTPAALGARCTVFMESDLVSHQQQGFARCDLVAGLARSVVANYIEKVVASHPTGKSALFLGGVAENRAVVAALEMELGVSVATSTVGRLSGAIGVALAAMEARRRRLFEKSAFSPNLALLEFESITCPDCPNSCKITKVRGTPPRHLGGRCGKWDGIIKKQFRHTSSAIEQRNEMLFGETGALVDASLAIEKSARIRIGIPRALLAFDLLPTWRTFFEGLGCEVVLSPETSDEILSEGMKRLVVETCLPVKAFCAHVLWLDRMGLDYIFVPSMVLTGMDRHRRETVHCPYIQSLAQFAMPIAETALLAPVINWKLDPESHEKTMLGIAAKLGIDRHTARSAWRKAMQAQDDFSAKLRLVGEEVLRALRSGSVARAFVLLGKDYNINDPSLSSGIAEAIESHGERAITQDMLAGDGGDYSAAYRTMYWTHGKEILAAAEIAASTPNLYPIFITSFGCGPDSFTLRFTRDIMGDKPMLVLDVDEHSSEVGIETRIEAFIDSLPKAPERRSGEGRRAFIPKREIRRVILPNFSDHGYAFASAIRSLGLTPVLTNLPDDESARLGAKHAPAGECHPYVLMLGDYIKAAQSSEDLSDACYFMPEGGACRVGQFGMQMRLVAEELGIDLPIFTRVEDMAAANGRHPLSNLLRSLITYWEVMRGMDFLSQLWLERRAYEIKPGSVDLAHTEAGRMLMDEIVNGDPIAGIRKARDIICRVPVDKTQRRVRIGITGDYYTRVCDYANGDLFREIERMGGVVMLPPTMTEFVKYEAHQRPRSAIKHRNSYEFIKSAVMRSTVGRRERNVRAIFKDDLDYDVPLNFKRAGRLIKPYMDMALPAGLTGSVAAIMEQINAGADGILSAITFHCSYGLVIGSVLAMIDRDYPDVPKMTLIFEGLKPTHNRLRLEAFMERVHSQASHRRK